jgi:cytochrome b subunit of formate dehydrogenase
MLTVPLDCPFLVALSVFSNVYLACFSCTKCWQCLWIVHSWLSIRFSLTFIFPVSCVLNAANVSGLSIFNCPSVFSNVYVSCVLCTQCWQCLWIVHSWLSPRFSLTFICPLSCVLNVDSFSGFSALDSPSFSLTFICPVSCVLNVDSTSGLSILDCPLGFL